jgi:hypothetical protein
MNRSPAINWLAANVQKFIGKDNARNGRHFAHAISFGAGLDCGSA